MKILHAFADTGVESYILREYGNVTRLGINPRTGLRDVMNFEGANEIVQGDGTQLPFKNNSFDLGFIHPPCTRYSKAHYIHKGKEGYNPPCYIKDARKEIDRVSKDYVIENLPNAPIRNDIILEGRMFGINYQMKRAFECSFDVKQPPKIDMDIPYCAIQKASKYDVMISKGYPDIWKGIEAKRSSIPAKYIHHILTSYLDNR